MPPGVKGSRRCMAGGVKTKKRATKFVALCGAFLVELGLVSPATTTASSATAAVSTTAATTTASSATAAVSATATATTTTSGARLGFVDLHGSSGTVLSVKAGNGSLCLFIAAHLDKAKAFALAGASISDDLSTLDGAECGKHLLQNGTRDIIPKISNIKLLTHNKISVHNVRDQ